MATGRHVREICRFAQMAAIEALSDGRPLAVEGIPNAAVVLSLPLTKAGVPAWVPVSAEVAESARKLLALGNVPSGKAGKGWSDVLHAACEAADIKAGRVPVVVLRELEKASAAVWARRTVRTFAGNKGFAPFCDDFLGHAKGTGEKHYGRHVPLKIPTMI
jgi:hypothetical protein